MIFSVMHRNDQSSWIAQFQYTYVTANSMSWPYPNERRWHRVRCGTDSVQKTLVHVFENHLIIFFLIKKSAAG